MPEAFGELPIKPCEPEEFRDCDIVFSGLDSSVATEIGKEALIRCWCTKHS